MSKLITNVKKKGFLFERLIITYKDGVVRSKQRMWLPGHDLIGYKICSQYNILFSKYISLIKEYPISYITRAEAIKYGCLVKLLIPRSAVIVAPGNEKLRCNYAKVLDINPLALKDEYKIYAEESIHLSEAFSFIVTTPGENGFEFKYTIGEEVYPDDFDISKKHKCSNGINFYLTKYNAIELFKTIIMDEYVSGITKNGYASANEMAKYYMPEKTL